jgi:hypothetical protein
MEQLDRRPGLTRLIGLAQVAGGIYWAIHDRIRTVYFQIFSVRSIGLQR